jgi:hypothetical protein
LAKKKLVVEDMLPIMQHIVMAFLFIGFFFLVLAHFFQTWECGDAFPYCGNWGVHPETIGRSDSTWGSRVMGWLLLIECAVMAAKAPGRGAVKTAIQVVFALECTRWLFDCILHSFMNEAGPGGDGVEHTFWILTVGVGSARLIAALVAAKDARECDCIPKVSAPAAAIITVATVVIILYLFVFNATTQQQQDLVSLWTHVTILGMIITAALARLEKWGAALFLIYLVCAFINHLEEGGWSYPFHYSADFNSEGLWRAVTMMVIAVLFGYYNGFVDNADEIKGEEKLEAALGLEDEAEEEVDDA